METQEVDGIKVTETPWTIRALSWVLLEIFIIPLGWVKVIVWENLDILIIAAFIVFHVVWCVSIPSWIMYGLGGIAALYLAVFLIFSILTAKDDKMDRYEQKGVVLKNLILLGLLVGFVPTVKVLGNGMVIYLLWKF